MRDAAVDTGPQGAIERFTALLGRDWVLTGPDSLALFGLDFSEERAATPAVVVRPETSDEVVDVVRIAAENGLAIVRAAVACPTRSLRRRAIRDRFYSTFVA